jgi:hypothetical protein
MVFICGRLKLVPYLKPNVRPEATREIHRNIATVGTGNDFVDMTPIAQEIKESIDK